MDSIEYVRKKLYHKPANISQFSFDTLTGPLIYQLFTAQDIYELYQISTSVRLSSKINKKYQLINDIMNRRGFKKFGAGMNRVVYKYMEDQSFAAKIAIDDVGISDNPSEFKNQWLINPFCTKIFDVDQTGVLSIVERVTPIISIAEYYRHADSIFAMLNNITGKYVASDIGCEYFRNIGIREGFGPVLLDFPYVYELDGDKLFCGLVFPNGNVCAGEIDYDEGFNDLVCKKCGKRYTAKDLSKEPGESGIIVKRGKTKMRIITRMGDQIISDTDTSKKGTDIIEPKYNVKRRKKLNDKKKEFVVTVRGWNPPVEKKEVEIQESDNESIVKEDSVICGLDMGTTSEGYTPNISTEEVDEIINSTRNEEDTIPEMESSVEDDKVETKVQINYSENASGKREILQINRFTENSDGEKISDEVLLNKEPDKYDLSEDLAKGICETIDQLRMNNNEKEEKFYANTGFISKPDENVDEDKQEAFSFIDQGPQDDGDKTYGDDDNVNVDISPDEINLMRERLQSSAPEFPDPDDTDIAIAEQSATVVPNDIGYELNMDSNGSNSKYPAKSNKAKRVR